MTGILNTTISGLRAYQGALTTTSHNISNVGTEGFSRQKVDLNTREPQSFGSINIGQGVEATNIYRVVDEFLTNNIRDFQSTYSRLDIFENFSTRVENLIADDQGSIMPALNNFFSAVNDVSNDPSANAPRVALLGAAENLQQRIYSLSTELENLSDEVDRRVVTQVNDINSLTSEIARINDSISSNSSVDNQPADLLDKRDGLLKELAEKISINVVEQSDGTLNVLAGTGQLLVTGPISVNLATQSDTIQTDRLSIVMQSTGGNIDITRTLSGGELGGLLDFRNNLLDTTQNQLGRTAIALAESFNDQHLQGYDLNGNLGTNFFSAGSPQSLANFNNTGSGTVTASISDAQALTLSDYQVRFPTAGTYEVVRMTDNVTVGAAFVAPGPSTVNVEGIDFVLAGTPVAGDSFYVRPTRNGATGFNSLITDANAIAAASPIRTSSAVANIGDLSISSGNIIDVSNASLLNTVSMTVSATGQLNIIDTALLPAPGQPISVDVTRPSTGATVVTINPSSNIVYEAGMTVTANGWQVQLKGNPEPGDVVTVQENVGAATDNRNSLSLADIRSLGILDGGVVSLEQSYSALTADVGTVAQRVIINKEVEGSLLLSSEQQRESISGVNLDEEAGDLIRFQQAYQALSRVVQTAQAIFQSLLEAV